MLKGSVHMDVQATKIWILKYENQLEKNKLANKQTADVPWFFTSKSSWCKWPFSTEPEVWAQLWKKLLADSTKLPQLNPSSANFGFGLFFVFWVFFFLQGHTILKYLLSTLHSIYFKEFILQCAVKTKKKRKGKQNVPIKTLPAHLVRLNMCSAIRWATDLRCLISTWRHGSVVLAIAIYFLLYWFKLSCNLLRQFSLI